MGSASQPVRTDTLEGGSPFRPIFKSSVRREPAAVRIFRTPRRPGMVWPGAARLDYPIPGEITPPSIDIAITNRRALPAREFIEGVH